MTQHLDGPKTYWGYYQYYLPQIYGKKFLPKNSIDFQQKSQGYSMPKTGQNASGGRFSNLVQKLNVRVQYNNLMPIWPAPMA